MIIARFTIDVPDAVLDDLAHRLERTRWPDEVAGAGWEYGVPRSELAGLVRYWRDRYDWRRAERELNALPQFLATDGDESLHFAHLHGAGPDPMPLLLLHGWPGSFFEFLYVAPRLADPVRFGGNPDDAFNVVVPSMPGFAFSSRPARPGMHVGRIAERYAALMAALGYARYGAHGGDFGAGVASRLGLQVADRLAGIHLNYIPGSYRPSLDPPAPDMTPEERAFLASADRWMEEHGAYAHLQATAPQTPSFALTDSPAGLAAWIVEKFRAWSDCDGHVENVFTNDDLLTSVMLYWVTETIASANRLYLEGRRHPLRFAPGQRIDVPCGIARFPLEEPFPPRSWIERGYRVVHWTDMPRGGHFAAMEQPDRLVEDIRAFFRPLRKP